MQKDISLDVFRDDHHNITNLGFLLYFLLNVVLFACKMRSVELLTTNMCIWVCVCT